VCEHLFCNRVAMLANLSPDSGNLANFESVWLQIFWFGDLAIFESTYSIFKRRVTIFKLDDGLKIRDIK